MGMTIRGTSQAAMVLILRSLRSGCSGDTPIWKRLGHVAQLLKNMPSVLEDVCIKLLTAAENDPALARHVRSKSSSHSSPLTHSSQSCHGFSGNPRCLLRCTRPKMARLRRAAMSDMSPRSRDKRIRPEVRRCAMQTMQGGEMEAPCRCGTVRFRVKLTYGFKTARRCTCSYCRMRERWRCLPI